MLSPQSSLTYLKQGFQWAAGLWVYANVLCLCVHGSGWDLLFLNALVVLPIVWQILAMRLKKYSVFFDGLTIFTYILILLSYFPIIFNVHFFYVWLIFLGSLIIVGRYFIRLRWFLFR